MAAVARTRAAMAMLRATGQVVMPRSAKTRAAMPVPREIRRMARIESHHEAILTILCGLAVKARGWPVLTDVPDDFLFYVPIGRLRS
jgi:hypothetical protein